MTKLFKQFILYKISIALTDTIKKLKTDSRHFEEKEHDLWVHHHEYDHFRPAEKEVVPD